jgi:tRNA-dihydrouridine synthase
MPLRLILAPLRGITDWPFRQAIARHFPGFHEAVAPFINPQKPGGKKLAPLADLLPEHNRLLPVVPQLLDNQPQSFLDMAKRLEYLGYTRLNWNLGCPAPMVTRKGRGAAMLAKPDEISLLLDFVLPRLSCRLSLKMRLGMSDRREIITMLPRLNNYPLDELIIHPRLGSQLFHGAPDLEGFAEVLAASAHPLVYNGDIVSLDDFRRLSARFPQVSGWMIGRGAVAQPFLAAAIAGREPPELSARLAAFHDELFAAYEKKLSGPGHLLGKMKQLWLYFIASFPGQEKFGKTIVRTHSLSHYREAVRAVFGQKKND